MAHQNTGYGAVNQNYGYGQDLSGGYPPPRPPMPGGYGNDNTFGGHYDGYSTGYDQPVPTYQPIGSYGAIGEPVKPAGMGYSQTGYDAGQFTSPPQEPNWQGYDGYGDRSFDNQGGYNDFSSQDNVPPSYMPDGLSRGFPSDSGGPAPRGNRGRGGMQQGRGGFDGIDGYTRGARGGSRGQYGAMRGTGRGQHDDGGLGQFDGGSRGRGQFGGGNRGRGLSDRGKGQAGGGGNRGRGQFDGNRGRGQVEGGNRGRGQFDGNRGGGQNRGRGQPDTVSRGRGQFNGSNRGSGQLGGGNRGRGQFDGNRGRGHSDGTNKGRGQSNGGNRGRGQFDSSSRGRGQLGGTRGRGWVPEGSQGLGQDGARGRDQAGARGGDQDASRGRGQVGGRGHGQTGNRGRGTDGTSGRGQCGGIRGRGQQEGTRGGGPANRGRGRGDGGNSVPSGVKSTKPFKMSSADGQGFVSYKNNLQEYAQKNHKPIPQYTAQKADLGFTANVCVDGTMFSCLQTEREKKDAEQSAAFEALKALGFIDANNMFTGKAKKRPSEEGESSAPSPKVAKQEQPVVPQPQSYKSKLNEAVMKLRLDLPTYTSIRTAGGFLSTLVLNGQVYQGMERHGTKKLAEQHVAEIVFKQLDLTTETIKAEGPVVLDITNAVLSTSDSDIEPSAVASSTPKPASTAPKAKPMKNIVQEYCQKNGMQIPIYNTIKDAGMVIATVTVNGVEYVGTPHIMKKTAEQNAAKKVCEQLGLK